MKLDDQGVMNAEAAGLREAVIAVFRQIEKLHPGTLKAATEDLNNVFSDISVPEDHHAQTRTIMRNYAVKTLEGAEP